MCSSVVGSLWGYLAVLCVRCKHFSSEVIKWHQGLFSLIILVMFVSVFLFHVCTCIKPRGGGRRMTCWSWFFNSGLVASVSTPWAISAAPWYCFLKNLFPWNKTHSLCIPSVLGCSMCVFYKLTLGSKNSAKWIC